MIAILYIIQATPLTEHLEKITDPILAILIIVMTGMIWLQIKQIKIRDKQIEGKDNYIKTLNTSLLEHSVKSLDVIKNLENSINIDNASHNVIRELLKDNNVFLQKIMDKIANFN